MMLRKNNAGEQCGSNVAKFLSGPYLGNVDLHRRVVLGANQLVGRGAESEKEKVM